MWREFRNEPERREKHLDNSAKHCLASATAWTHARYPKQAAMGGWETSTIGACMIIYFVGSRLGMKG